MGSARSSVAWLSSQVRCNLRDVVEAFDSESVVTFLLGKMAFKMALYWQKLVNDRDLLPVKGLPWLNATT